MAKKFIEELRTDDSLRAHFVEELRTAAQILEGGEPYAQLPEASRVRVAIRIAARLRDVSHRLCDHIRVGSDGTCRYCETLIDLELPQ